MSGKEHFRTLPLSDAVEQGAVSSEAAESSPEAALVQLLGDEELKLRLARWLAPEIEKALAEREREYADWLEWVHAETVRKQREADKRSLEYRQAKRRADARLVAEYEAELRREGLSVE